MNFFNPFRAPPRAEEWFPVGLASTFPNLDRDNEGLASRRPCDAGSKPGCKVFHAPRAESRRTEVPVEEDAVETEESKRDLKDQVMVFQYRGKFHAIDHQCPHSSYPLSKGMPFDIEDFGIVLSAGITCSKHGWSFDLHSGMSDRGQYKLGVWEVQMRDVTGASEEEGAVADKEVWVRRKPRMG